ncbi:hypothetical protein PTSG_12912 [Salpingoeca rosetta]|uniref:Sulfatase N-terminal domain-containing protein n=1 Tax=Salpingoeca rosetta (strain ATCC 50818 / BSB-021) TaxID=946362 RepID=F2UNT0_SALR5|nr:uncharacterized protein PTSG_12912 [Salpingoeca rosetta]EGD79285.1 hypothetical protein PTSG_12912 [Salpingoeca rosetta]|eukprot:XP_004989056.1 hypothetical protein PTSG_12912 [Salpingoeca rosetta]
MMMMMRLLGVALVVGVMAVAALPAPAAATAAAAAVRTIGGDDDAAAPPSNQPPHILMVLVDDLGWADVGYHRSGPHKSDIQTPTIDKLVSQGIALERHYVHKVCSPTRASFQSGRLPVHGIDGQVVLCAPRAGIPENMTTVAQHLNKAGYASHFVGKWDVGMATPSHTPHGRGYNTSLNYFGHANWMWNQDEWQGSQNNVSHRPPCKAPDCFKDFWDTDRPAHNLSGTLYEEQLFVQRITDIIEAHDPSQPLFLTYASKVAHYPLQAPIEYQQQFANIEPPSRRVYHAMVKYLDDNLYYITTLMQKKGMWNNTLMVFSSDNGGPVMAFDGDCDASHPSRGYMCYNGEAGANNYPLRGGKYSFFEGGIRVNAFVSGGLIPADQRGSNRTGIMHIADWYATFCALAGVDPTDHRAAAANLPPIDSHNMWPYLAGQARFSPRDTVLVDRDVLVFGDYKLLLGASNPMANWSGPAYPNATTATSPISRYTLNCSDPGCLFNVVEDPEERHDLAEEKPDILKLMKFTLTELAKSIFPYNPGPVDPQCMKTAETKYDGFYGPWLNLDG